ncbi:MAG: energy transducer TonB, partial [Acidobacteria bacterium]|nr:energy transducer TonB [Acidobacteriota bacterium]
FSLNTRAWGPPDPLSDAEVRKLASNIVEPTFPPNAAPQGATYTLMIAVDSDGSLIEVIAGGGPPGLSQYALEAIRKWKFSPVMENGEPRPYRGQVDFRVQ